MSELTPSRVLRAVVFATVCVGVSAFGHAVSSGHAVPWPAALAGFAVVAVLAWAVARREQGQVAIAGWLAWGQLALHLLYSVAQDRAAPAPMPGMSGAEHAAVVAVPDGSGSGMLAAHLLAVAVSAWWLRRGEAAAFAFARLLRAVLLGPLFAPPGSPPPPARPPRRPVPTPGARPRAVRLLRHCLVPHAPPAPSPA